MRWPFIIFYWWDSCFVTHLLHTLWTLSQTLLCEGLNWWPLLSSFHLPNHLQLQHHYCTCWMTISLRYRQPHSVCACSWVPCFVPTGMGLLVCTLSLVNSFSKVAILQLTLCQHCISCTAVDTCHQFWVHIPMCDSNNLQGLLFSQK